MPWDEIVGDFGQKECKKGPRSLFSSKDKLGLMFLKNYSGFSDRKLMEQLNGNLDWQFFCDIYLGAARLDNFKMISEIRCELARKLDMDRVQEAFYGHWSPYMRDKGCIAMDATCYESHLRYPTNIKLLWEAVDWLHGLIKDICKTTGETLPSSKTTFSVVQTIGNKNEKQKTRKFHVF